MVKGHVWAIQSKHPIDLSNCQYSLFTIEKRRQTKTYFTCELWISHLVSGEMKTFLRERERKGKRKNEPKNQNEIWSFWLLFRLMPNQHKRDYSFSSISSPLASISQCLCNSFLFLTFWKLIFYFSGHVKSFVTIEFLLVLHVWSDTIAIFIMKMWKRNLAIWWFVYAFFSGILLCHRCVFFLFSCRSLVVHDPLRLFGEYYFIKLLFSWQFLIRCRLPIAHCYPISAMACVMCTLYMWCLGFPISDECWMECHGILKLCMNTE